MPTQKTAVDTGKIFLEKVTELIVPTLKDVEESLAKINQAQAQLMVQLDEIKREVSDFATRLEQIEVKVPKPDTKAFEILASLWYNKVVQALETFPKKHSFQVLFFPEHNTINYLKKLWSGVFFWLFCTVIALVLYSLTCKWLDKY